MEGLAGIFDEDDPPSVAVAASATQSFQSIIGCAWRKYLIEKCHLSKEHVTNAMQIGMLPLYTKKMFWLKLISVEKFLRVKN